MIRLLMAVGVCLLWALPVEAAAFKRSQPPQVCIESMCFNVEVASTPLEMQKGLQLRSELKPDSGMIFIFARPGVHSFWMKDTIIPLDMIWIDQSRKVVGVTHDVPPCFSDPCPVYPPPGPILYVLEVNAGAAKANNITPGTSVTFNNIYP